MIGDGTNINPSWSFLGTADLEVTMMRCKVIKWIRRSTNGRMTAALGRRSTEVFTDHRRKGRDRYAGHFAAGGRAMSLGND